MTEAKISVIVPVYNAAAWLHDCVDSILAQTQPRLEIILVDDGATDESPAICEAYAAKHENVRVLHKENGGLMSAWMAGVEIATGAYFCFVDSDDWVEPDFVAEMAGHAEENVPEIVCSNHIFEYEGGRSVAGWHEAAPGVYTGAALREKIFQKILGNEQRTVTMSRCMKLISAGLIRKNLHYCNQRIRMGEDVNIILPAMLDAERLVVLPGANHYHYRYREASMAHGYDASLNDNMRALRRVVRTVLRDKAARILPEAPPEERARFCRDMLRRETLFLFMLQLKNEFRNPAPGAARRIRALCEREHIAALTKAAPIAVRSMENRLLYQAMRHPNLPTIRAVRACFKLRQSLRTRR